MHRVWGPSLVTMDNSEEEMAVSISAVGAVAYVCCTVTFILLVCLLFFLGLTPTQRSAENIWGISYPSLSAKIWGNIVLKIPENWVCCPTRYGWIGIWGETLSGFSELWNPNRAQVGIGEGTINKKLMTSTIVDYSMTKPWLQALTFPWLFLDQNPCSQQYGKSGTTQILGNLKTAFMLSSLLKHIQGLFYVLS